VQSDAQVVRQLVSVVLHLALHGGTGGEVQAASQLVRVAPHASPHVFAEAVQVDGGVQGVVSGAAVSNVSVVAVSRLESVVVESAKVSFVPVESAAPSEVAS
jgi:hypothetical protein